MSTATVATFVRWSMASAGLTPPFADALQVPVTYGPLPVLGARRVAAYHRAGSQVHVWTVNEEPVMERLLDDGVDGIITDRPDLLRAVLERRGQWTGGGRVS
jgi:glycerophosphoryl diester phosphodiesterase